MQSCVPLSTSRQTFVVFPHWGYMSRPFPGHKPAFNACRRRAFAGMACHRNLRHSTHLCRLVAGEQRGSTQGYVPHGTSRQALPGPCLSKA